MEYRVGKPKKQGEYLPIKKERKKSLTQPLFRSTKAEEDVVKGPWICVSAPKTFSAFLYSKPRSTYSVVGYYHSWADAAANAKNFSYSDPAHFFWIVRSDDFWSEVKWL